MNAHSFGYATGMTACSLRQEICAIGFIGGINS